MGGRDQLSLGAAGSEVQLIIANEAALQSGRVWIRYLESSKSCVAWHLDGKRLMTVVCVVIR